VPNDSQIYHITCKLFESNLCNAPPLNNSHVFNFQPGDEKIYKIIAEMVPHSLIVQFLNRTMHGIEFSKQQPQEYLSFSHEQKLNLETHLKKFLFDYLTSKQNNLIGGVQPQIKYLNKL
ncbi:12157_t:CDS:1, partial [Funneliformis mosseae]